MLPLFSNRNTISQLQNVHGFFTLPGLVDRPFIYSTAHISEGRSYCTRSVTVHQPTTPSSISSAGTFDSQDAEKELGKICFTCICSFKRDEAGATTHQANMDLEETYAVVVKGRDPSTHPVPPRIDAPWYLKLAAEQGLTYNFPGLEMRRADMSAFNASKHPIDYRQLTYYRCLGPLPPKDYNFHACAHLYASDRNSCFIISNAVGFGDEVNVMGSLSHSVVFHVKSEDLVLRDGEWWCQEAWTPRSEGGRGIHESRIWDVRGLHVASTWQDGLVRKAEREEDQKQKRAWFEGMERAGKLKRGEREGLGKTKL
jgi:acyl-CoA thioesterase II